MILYHGSNVEVKEPRILEPSHSLDFLVFATVKAAFIRAEGITDGENATALDYGDVLLKSGRVSQEEYDALQTHARNLIQAHERGNKR